MAEEPNVIPIIKLWNNNGPYYPLGVLESVYTTHTFEVEDDIGSYKKGDIIDPLTQLDTIIANILGARGRHQAANFIGVSLNDPGDNDGYPPALELDTGDIYTSDQYSEGDVVIYNNDDASNVLCIFYKKAGEPHGKWLVISDDLIYVGDENNPPPEKSKKKVLWLDTTTKTIDTYTDSPEMESIKNLVYKLMMAYGKVVKLVENGIKPTDATGVISEAGGIVSAGTEVNNWRRELINAADPEQPVDVIPSSDLETITIYGNDYTGSGSLYRALFTPNGFTDKQCEWTFGNGTKKTALKNEAGETLGYAEIHAETSKRGLEKPECTLELYMWDEATGKKSPIIYDEIVDTPIELKATYNIDPYLGDDAIVGSKMLKVGGEKPATDVEPTVKSVCIKMDTSENFAAHVDDLIDGELLFYTDKAKFAVYRCFKNEKDIWVQKFYALQTDESEGRGLTEDQLYQLALKYLQFKDPQGNIYRVYVDSDGNWKLKRVDTNYITNSFDGDFTGGGSNTRYLSMGVIYCGGDSTTEGKCSHNFVEIYNSSIDKDFNLSGMFLLYTDCSVWSGSTGYIWKVLPLEGTIKAGSTFTIRGARSNRDDACFIKVDHYDQEWLDDNGKPVAFNVNKGGFYLVNGMTVNQERVLPTDLRNALNNHTFIAFSSAEIPVGYIDGFGFHNRNITESIPCEKSALLISPDTVDAEHSEGIVTADQVIFTKNFILDPSKQALKAYTSKNTTTLWTYIKIDKQTEKLGNSVQYYWPDSMKKSYTPGAIEDKHDFYNYGRSIFDPKKPNVVNITFGKQATATVNFETPVYQDSTYYYPITEDTTLRNEACSTGHAFKDNFEPVTVPSSAVYTDNTKYAKYTVNSDASRCFNWISVGNYDEYVEYRKQGTEVWTRLYSIIPNDASDPDSMVGGHDAPFIEFYKRFTWPAGYGNVWVTSHKRIIRGLSSGIYEYRIGRDDDLSYLSDVKTFEVKNDAEVNSFRFVQVTDQQGFNWSEYMAWKRSAYMINKAAKENSDQTYDFSVNTGDIGQSGNRVSEFIDYFKGREPMNDHVEMFTIGNNDLCSRNPTKFGKGEDFDSKYNHVNVRKYYCFELDPANVDDEGKSNYFIPSIDLPMDLEGLTLKNFTNIPVDSVYSFNYGKYHFISLNSEYTSATVSIYNKLVYDTNTIKYDAAKKLVNAYNERLEKWLKKDLLLWKPESYPSTTDIKYMCGKKYYWYRDEFGAVTTDIREMVPNVNYRVSDDPLNPTVGSDGVGHVYFKNGSAYEEHVISSSEIRVHEPYDCSKCFVYMHEMPFTIVTDKFILGNGGREGSKLNNFNNMGDYRYSRLFHKFGIRLVFGGHKHTYSVSRPTYDAPEDYLVNGTIYLDYTDQVCGTGINDYLSRQPVVQYLDIGADVEGGGFNDLESADGIRAGRTLVACRLLQTCIYKSTERQPGWYLYAKDDWLKATETAKGDKTLYTVTISNDKGTSLITRCEFVSIFTAPTYVMSQATGFKLVSNKELMCNSRNIVPWMLTCCNEKNETTETTDDRKPGRNQLDPMYIIYDVNSDTGKVTLDMHVVKNIYDVKENAKGFYDTTCTMNKQNPNLVNEVLFEQTLENI